MDHDIVSPDTGTRPERLLRLRQVQDRVPIGRATIYKRMAAGTFPKTVDLGGGIVAWRESEIEQWIAGLGAQSSKVT
jgi:prophage regulatory protein